MLEAVPVARDALVCPGCNTRLMATADDVRCTTCGRSYTLNDGYVDFGTASQKRSGHASRAMNDPLLPRVYDTFGRAAFLRLMGSNWGKEFSEEDEERYLHDRLAGIEGPVLDLGCGTGRWTRVAVDAVGHDQVVALDLSVPMLSSVGEALPNLLLVRASATSLPFASASLGAVVCWNALQMFPEPQRVIGEVGRCLRPGGTFVALTFRDADDHVYGYFQRQLGRAFNIRVFREDEMSGWLTAAGMKVEGLAGPGSFLLVSASKPGSQRFTA